MTGHQGSLFDDDPPPPSEKVGLAPDAARWRGLAQSLPKGLRLGTSSWSFPGWQGLVWDREVSQRLLAREGLAAYARHPLFRSVGLDRTYYAPIEARALAEYAQVVPEDFRFLVKAHEWCTVPVFSDHPRAGARRGKENALFLDAGYATDVVIGPLVEGLGKKVGPVLFQFPPLELAVVGGPRGFAEKLHGFLASLPVGPRYTVELRNSRLLTPTYRQALAETGTSHCLNAHPTMPTPSEQLRILKGKVGPAHVIRWMLARPLSYASAKTRYAPFDHLVDEDPATRQDLASLCRDACGDGRDVTVIINNKAEGCAPESVRRLAEAFVASG